MYWGYLFGIQEVFSAIGEYAFNDENKENIKYKNTFRYHQSKMKTMFLS